ncbi:MAG: syntaxin [Amphiamblys sp. WSBS2006]|nr:MAG: syntaxin [Amphiamblys sp. WSBS2006]
MARLKLEEVSSEVMALGKKIELVRRSLPKTFSRHTMAVAEREVLAAEKLFDAATQKVADYANTQNPSTKHLRRLSSALNIMLGEFQPLQVQVAAAKKDLLDKTRSEYSLFLTDGDTPLLHSITHLSQLQEEIHADESALEERRQKIKSIAEKVGTIEALFGQISQMAHVQSHSLGSIEENIEETNSFLARTETQLARTRRRRELGTIVRLSIIVGVFFFLLFILRTVL